MANNQSMPSLYSGEKSLTREQFLRVWIEELDLGVREYNFLVKSGIKTVGEALDKLSVEYMGARTLGRSNREKVLERIQEYEEKYVIPDESDPVTYPGHEKCEKLRQIRKKIAEQNDIEFEIATCYHKGPCPGTCQVCDDEIKYLDEMLQKKKANGEEVKLFGIASDDIESSGIHMG